MYLCFVDLEEAFDRAPRRMMEWAARKNGLLEIPVKVVISLYEGAETKELIVTVGKIFCESKCTPRICELPLLFAMVVDEVMENARKG